MSATIDDIAKACGLSRATVSRVLRNSPGVSQKARLAVEKVVEQTGYRPNQMARSLAQGYSNIVSLIIGNISSSAQIEIVKSIQKKLYESGYMCLLCNSDYNVTMCDEYLDTVMSNKLAGAFLISTEGTPLRMQQLLEQNIPLIMVNRYDMTVSCDSVLADDQKAAYQAVEHLLRLGHRKIVLLNVSQALVAGRNAYSGYRIAMKKNGIPFDESCVYTIDINRYADVIGIRQAFDAQRVFEEHPDATGVVCLVAEIAVDFYHKCNQNGKHIPNDYSLIILDPVGQNDLPTLSFDSYGVSQQIMGEAAADQMLKRIEARKCKERGNEAPMIYSRVVLEPSYQSGSSIRMLD